MERLPLWRAGNLALVLASVLGVAWFWTPQAQRLISLESGSAQVLFRQRQCQIYRRANVLVLGNSLAGEGFLVNLFNQNARQHFAINLAVPSAHWFLLERVAEMARREGIRPRAVVLMTAPEHFSERKDFDFLENDLTLAKPLLDGGDLLRLAGHTRTPLRYADSAPLILLRPMLYRGELRSLMLRPSAHHAQVERLQEVLSAMTAGEPMAENGNAFSVCEVGDLQGLESRLPAMRERQEPRLGDSERIVAGLRARVGIPMVVDPREMARFRRVLRLLHEMAPRVIVAPAPFYDPDFLQYPAGFRQEMAQAIEETVAQTPGAVLLKPLETDCSDFMDTVHFNRKGAERFTRQLLDAMEGRHSQESRAADGL
jgi:hypothetical protein